MPVRAIVVAFSLAASMALVACGESAEDKAQGQVCDAKSDIQQQVDTLRGLTLSTTSIDAAQQAIGAIGDNLSTIKDAQGDLNGQRKQDAEDAVSAFQSEISNIAGDLVAGLTGGQAALAQAEAALRQLGNGFREAFAPVDC